MVADSDGPESVADLNTLDRYGYPAYLCSLDQRPFDVVPGTDGVLTCPVCGRRTDNPGEGVLGDAFDVMHRQWGMRGDPHVWEALRDLLADAPTPCQTGAVRHAFTDGIHRLTGIDVDREERHQVYLDGFDHGGMSGGVLDVDWWRQEGIPLLVQRAVERRPSDEGSVL